MRLKRRDALRFGSLVAAGSVTVQSIPESEAKSKNDENSDVADLAISNNWTESEKIEVEISEIYEDESTEIVYKEEFKLKGFKSSENPSQEEAHMKGKIKSDSGKTGPHKAVVRLDNGETTTETFSFSKDGFPSQEMLSVYVNSSHKLKSYHLYS